MAEQGEIYLFLNSLDGQSMKRGLLIRSEILLSFLLSTHSSLGPHDQSVFLLTELQTAWNQDEIGLQTEVNPSPSISLALLTLRHLEKMSQSMFFSISGKQQIYYFWLSF